MEEIIQCRKCRGEFSFLYENEDVVSQTYCKCKRNKYKTLDQVMRELDDLSKQNNPAGLAKKLLRKIREGLRKLGNIGRSWLWENLCCHNDYPQDTRDTWKEKHSDHLSKCRDKQLEK